MTSTLRSLFHPTRPGAALAAVRRKDWKPSANLEKACADAPSNLVMLGVTDVAESLPSLLASLPGTLQTMINTSIAVAKADAGAGAKRAPVMAPRPAPEVPGQVRAARPGGRGGMMARAGGPRYARRRKAPTNLRAAAARTLATVVTSRLMPTSCPSRRI